MSELRVAILEDDPLTASVYEEYLRRIPCVKHVRSELTLRGMLRFAEGQLRLHGELGVDLLLVDMNLPDGHGLEALRRLRGLGWGGGAVALTASSERRVVRGALALGVSDYLLKPFTWEDLAARVEGFRDLDRLLGSRGTIPAQEQLDAIFGARGAGPEPPGAGHGSGQGSARVPRIPKGMQEETLHQVADALAAAPSPLSAREAAEATGLSRVTARRYLEHLVDTGRASRSSRHGTPGRPEVEYTHRPQ